MPLTLQGPELEPGFMVIHGNRLEALRGLAVEWMRRHPLGPLENETILVQSNGISQWLKLALAADESRGGAGIAAALDVSLPARFLWQAYRAVLGEEQVPPVSPFDKPRLVWRLMRLLPALLDAPVFAPLARFLEGDDDLRKRHQLAERLADLFDQYQVYRADWLTAWAAGEDVLITARGEARPLAEEQRWQAELWRALRDDIARAHGEAGLASSRAAVHEQFLAACRELDATSRPPGLPRRVIVFGISSLPAQTLEALAAVARVSQVLLCVHNPCRHYWADIIEHKDLLRAERKRQRRRPGMSADLAETELHLHAQPLLAAWGKQGRDYLRLLDEFDEQQAYRGLFEGEALRIDLFDSPLHHNAEPSLLRQLQDDILELRPLAESRATWPAVDPAQDRSLRFQVAHSALREVEVLHDQLLAAFSEDPTLRPRDILVMVPDVDQYAAAVQAVFGRLDPDDPRHIPFTLSDQASRHRLPLLIALESLLRLPELRLSVSDLLDLLEVPAVRARFAVPESGLPTLRRWIEGAGIRWGLDARQRQSLDLPGGMAANTWAFGLRRLLLGYAVGDAADGPWQGVEPYDDIGGLEAALAGPLVSLIDTLEAQWQTLAEPCDVATWGERLRELLAACFLADSDQDLMALTRLEQALDAWQESAEEAGLTEPLPLSVVRDHWLAQVDEASLSQRFLAGAVNIATLMPMRAIPFRHVCLLGMNDADYPRVQRPLDIDLMAQDYRPGDRSRREDDRYLFLEALLSARDRLSISWVGRSIVDNTEQPPSVLLGQLRDHLARGWTLSAEGRAGQAADDGGKALLAALTTEHPLQPFSIEYFRGAAPGTGGEGSPLSTYAHEWRELHLPGDESAPPEPAPLAPFRQEAPLTLAQLGAFLRAPVQAFTTTRLKVFLELDAMERLDHEPFTLGGLDHWQLQHALIEASRAAVEAGEPHEPAMLATLERLERQGRLAMGGFAERMRDSLVEPMESLFADYRQVLDEWPHAMEEPLTVSLDLREALGEGADESPSGGLALEDWLGELRVNDAMERCRVLLTTSSLVNKGKYHWKHWLGPWVAHLAGQLEGPMTTRLLSRAGGGTLAPLPAEEARARLADIAAAWQHGMATPLPLPRDTAFAWLEKGGSPAAMARCLAGTPSEEDDKAWKAASTVFYGSGFNNDHGERGRDPYLLRQWPELEEMVRSPEGGGFAELAERLYAPLLHAVRKPKEKKGNGGKGNGGKGKGGKA